MSKKKIHFNSIEGYQIIQIHNINEIRKVLYDFDKAFKPSLSERIIDLNEYAEKLYKNAMFFQHSIVTL